MTGVRAISTLLRDPTLLRSSSFVNGRFARFPGTALNILNPWDQSVIHTVNQISLPAHSVVTEVVSAAKQSLPGWGTTSQSKRAAILQRVAQLLHENSDDLAALITTENGKPLVQAHGEVQYAASFFEWSSQTALTRNGTLIDAYNDNSLNYITRTPVGVVCAITPWNFPLAMLSRKAAPALMAGCAVVSKPSEVTPLSALALAEIMRRAGVPSGVFQVVVSEHGKQILDCLLHDGINMVSFTGSTRVGRIIAGAASLAGVKSILELGGNAPFVVLKDACVDRAVETVVTNKIRASGQTCVSANRIYVHEDVHDQFVSRLMGRVSELKHGNGVEEGVDIGPMISAEAAARVKALVDKAVSDGAVVENTDRAASRGVGAKHDGSLMQSCVVTGVTDSMELASSEIFGPVWSVLKLSADEDEEMIADRCNRPGAGLVAYVFGRDAARLHQLTYRLRFGMIAVNSGSVSYATIPFGGMGTSGYGREGGMSALDAYSEVKCVLHHHA